MTTSLRPSAAIGLLATCALIDGPTGLLIGLVVVIALRAGATGTQLIAAAIAALGLAALANLMPGLPDRLAISATFVTDRMLSHHLAFGGVALLVVGVLVDVRMSSSAAADDQR